MSATKNGTAAILRPSPFILPLCSPRGLQLVRYGGGEDIRVADVLLHLSAVLPASATALRELVRAAAAAAVARAHAEGVPAADHLPDRLDALDAVDVAIVVSAAPPRAPAGSAPLQSTRACFFHHGWLHGDTVSARTLAGDGSGVQSYPLIGAFAARGCVRVDKGDGDAWDDLAAPFSAASTSLLLKPFDQHAHTTEIYNGLGREGFIRQYQEELTLTVEEATAAADAELAAFSLQGWHVGSDGARAQFAGDVGATWVVCVDARRSAEGEPAPSPRAVLSLLLIVADPALHAAVRAVGDCVGEDGAASRDVLARLIAAVPALAPFISGDEFEFL
jgi:hypothetical protein